MKRIDLTHLFVLSIGLWIGAMSGCKTMELEQQTLLPFSQPAEAKKPKPDAIPVRMAVIWTDTSLSNTQGAAKRGFGGRLYFYNLDDEPIRVDGELTIFAFDDTAEIGVERHRSKVPDRKYVFRAEELQQYFSETDLGASYSVWVPWDNVGGVRKTVSLVPVFRSTHDQLVKGGQSTAVLPGRDPHPELTKAFREAREQSGKITYLTRQQSAALGNQVDQIMPPAMSPDASRTTTFTLPRTMSERMKGLPPQTVPQKGNSAVASATASGTSWQADADTQRVSSTTPQVASEVQKSSLATTPERSDVAKEVSASPINASGTSSANARRDPREGTRSSSVYGRPGSFR